MQPNIAKLDKLEYLFIGSPDLVYFPSKLGELINLKQLEINCSNLTSLPPIINLYDLLVLKVMAGKMTGLSVNFHDMNHLKYLEIGGVSKFNSFSEDLCELTELEELELNIPSAKNIPACIGNMKSLKKIHLNEATKIENFPESISNLTNLKEIYLANFDLEFEGQSLKRINHPFTLILNRGNYPRQAKYLLEVPQLEKLILPSNILPQELKKVKELLGEGKVQVMELN